VRIPPGRRSLPHSNVPGHYPKDTKRFKLAQASHWFRFVSFFVQLYVTDDDHSKDEKVAIAVKPRLARYPSIV